MGWFIFWLISGIIAVLALNFSIIKDKYKDFEDILNTEKGAYYKARLAAMRWVIKPQGAIMAFILGPITILICLVVYQRNFSIYFKVPK